MLVMRGSRVHRVLCCMRLSAGNHGQRRARGRFAHPFEEPFTAARRAQHEHARLRRLRLEAMRRATAPEHEVARASQTRLSAGEEELDLALEHEEHPPLPLTDQDRQALAEGAVQAYLAVLGAIVREAGRRDSSDGPRNVSRHGACRRGGLDVHRFGYTRPHSGAVTT